MTANGQTTTFVYDGDGNRVKKTDPGGTTHYVGEIYETRGITDTKYYYLSGQRIAMRVDDGSTSVVYWLHGDHLGSTSLTTDASGNVVAEQRYYPYGEVRWTNGALPTDFTYTGQRTDSYIDIIQMGARWYNSRTGRWISADPIIPGFANPQNFNRYSYVRNNSLRYTDPSGHAADAGGVGGIDPLLEGYERGWEDIASYSEFRDAYYTGVAAATAKMWRRPDPIDIASAMGEALVGDDAPLVQLALLGWLDTERMWAAAAAQSEQAQAELYMLGAAAAYQPKTFEEPGYTLVPETEYSHNLGPVRSGGQHSTGAGSLDGLVEMPFDNVRDGNTLCAWTQRLEDRMKGEQDLVLTTDQANTLVEYARNYGVSIKANAGHNDSNWSGRHLHFGTRRFHIRVPEGYPDP